MRTPRQLGDCRKLYWHPDTFYGVLDRRLWVDPASIALPAPEPAALRRNQHCKADVHSEAAATGSNSATGAPPSPRKRRDAPARQAERLKKLNR